jgi:hypothetical protein
MVQSDFTRERVDASNGSLVGSYSKNLDITSTDTFAIILNIDTRGVRESIFSIFNTHASNSIDYDIWGNLDSNPITSLTGTADTDYDNGWVLIKTTTSQASGAAPAVETLSNPYTRVVVRIKATSGGNQGTVRIWHRGEN